MGALPERKDDCGTTVAKRSCSMQSMPCIYGKDIGWRADRGQPSHRIWLLALGRHPTYLI